MLKNFFIKLKTTYFYSVVVFFIFFILVIFLTASFRISLLNQASQKFDSKSEEITKTVENNFSNYVNFLNDVKGFFAGSSDVTRQGYSNFIETISLQDRFPGINTIAFAKKVLKNDKDSFLNSLNTDPIINPEGGERYKLAPEEDKEQYFYSYYIEPYAPYTTLFGFDVTSIKDRVDEINQAIKTGEPTMTEKVPLVGKYTGLYGFNIFIPIYKNGSDVSTEASRIQNIDGILTGSFRLDNVFQKIFSDTDLFKDLSLKIYTDGSRTEKNKLFDSNVDVSEGNTLDKIKTITITGKEWDFDYLAKNYYGLSNPEKVIPISTLIAGTIFSIFFAFFYFTLKKSQVNALRLANIANSKLEQNEVSLNNILTSVDLIVFALDKNGKFTAAAGKGLEILKIKPEDLIGKSVYTKYNDSGDYLDSVRKAINGELVTANTKAGGFIFETKLTPVFDEKTGHVSSVVGVSQNITEREEFENKLKSNAEELARINKIMVNRELKMIELKKKIKNKETE